ncbi:hypothetical protein [Phaffia rhodozyma]|uniref:Uncharacterized protein n=1 Tax=Phaffia rhodozyma TaxID=264483 RepID=A0A0F7SM32_PHARH|nr:hypothetical protein [Phaffia rhodozyma]
MLSTYLSTTGGDHRVTFAQQQQQQQQQQKQSWQQQQQQQPGRSPYLSANTPLAPISSPERAYHPNAGADDSGRQTPSPSLPTESPTNPFVSPFSTPAPSPALAWGPTRSPVGSTAHEKEEGVSRGMIGGGDTGRERKSVFWNRFSIIAHNASAVESDAGWLQAKKAKDSRMGKILWLMVFVMLFVIAGAITAHYLTKEPALTTGTGSNRYGSLGSPSTAGDITTDVTKRTIASSEPVWRIIVWRQAQ